MLIRKLRHNEPLPIKTGSVFDERPDPAFTWIAEKDGRAVGVLLACEAHGTLFIMKVKAFGDDPIASGLLCRAAAQDATARGLKYLTTILNIRLPTESRFLQLLGRIKGTLVSAPMNAIWTTVPLEAIRNAG